ncbi:beta-N-acetylhexosaminidase [Zhouia amylolytica]|uniref:beta-N-acetylhexosaminidase n=1 Tax=Zhouia amylolytica AD3 TaxID=1286632 RepID=W2UP97_9FLAO|nr:beta-N-acetylhexosaminidase [Zhouia amylolytica]ETN95291.1 hypothetical protein P278_10130 [Zhouia amylolytica AD3]
MENCLYSLSGFNFYFKGNILLLFLLLCGISLQSQIIPNPEVMNMNSESFMFDSKVGLVYKNLSKADRGFLIPYLKKSIEKESGIIVDTGKKQPKNIILEINTKSAREQNDESYQLYIDRTKIHLRANSYEGLFYATQSFLQYFTFYNTSIPVKLPGLTVYDKPAVNWRGMMLDVSRHFYSVEAIKRVLDLIAYYKLNVFHWHLTDNEGWRIQIKKYPKLTTIGAWRNEIPGSIFYKKDSSYTKPLAIEPYPYGGFYTQQQIREVVEYARQRGVMVIPEIDLPGHSAAALTAYPEYSCEGYRHPAPNSTLWNGKVDTDKVNFNYCPGKESSFIFIEDILTEVMELFPSRYIHIGGDEVDKQYWQRCDECQQRMHSERLKDENELQSYFLKRVTSFLEKNNRTVIGWDDILEGGAPESAIIMSWRGEKGAINGAKQNHHVIMSPSNPFYFNRYQDDPAKEPLAASYSINTLQRVYEYNIWPEQLDENGKGLIKGGQFAVWTEFISSLEHLEYMLLPRLPAFSENLWSLDQRKNYNDFIKRLNQGHYDVWKRSGIRFHPKYYNKSDY